MADKYTMIATCHNCGTSFSIEVSKGTSTSDHRTICPYCGRVHYNGLYGFSYKRPIDGQ